MAASGEPRRHGARAERAAALFDGGRTPLDEAEAELARTVAVLRAVPAPTMSAGARARTRMLLLGLPAGALAGVTTPAASDSPTPDSPAPVPVPGSGTGSAVGPRTAGRGLAPRRVTRPDGRGVRRALRTARPALIGALAASVTAVGVTVSATHALPGELLYGVKRQVEQIQVSLAANRVDRAKIQLAVARTRMDELAAVVGPAMTGPRTGRGTGGTDDPRGTSGSGGTGGQPAVAGTGTAPADAGSIPPPDGDVPGGLPARDGSESGPGPGPGPGAAHGGSGQSGSPPGDADGDPPVAHTDDRPYPASSPATAPGVTPGTPGDVHPRVDVAREIGTATALLRDWCADAAAGSEVLIEEVRSGNADAWRTLNDFAADQSTRLDALLGAFPDSSAPEVVEARRIIREVSSVLTYTAPASGTRTPDGARTTDGAQNLDGALTPGGPAAPGHGATPRGGGPAPAGSGSDPDQPGGGASAGGAGDARRPGPVLHPAELGEEAGDALPAPPRGGSAPASTLSEAPDTGQATETDQGTGEGQGEGRAATGGTPGSPTPPAAPTPPASPTAAEEDLPVVPDVLGSLRLFEAPAGPEPSAVGTPPGATGPQPDAGPAPVGGGTSDGDTSGGGAAAPSAPAVTGPTQSPGAEGTIAAPPQTPPPGSDTVATSPTPTVHSTGPAPDASTEDP